MERIVSCRDDILFLVDKMLEERFDVCLDLSWFKRKSDLFEAFLLLDFYKVKVNSFIKDKYDVIHRLNKDVIINRPTLIYCKIKPDVTVYLYAKCVFFKKIYGRIIGKKKYLIRRRG